MKPMTEGRKAIAALPVLGVLKHPKDGKAFCVPPEVAAVFGENPLRIEFVLPVDDIDAVYQESNRRYGGKVLRCIGSEGIGRDKDVKTGVVTEKACPCEFLENKQCVLTGAFHVMIPSVSLGGQYVLYTRSWRSSAVIKTTLANLQLLYGRITQIPLTLTRTLTKMKYDTNKVKDYWIINIVPPAPAGSQQPASTMAAPPSEPVPAQETAKVPQEEAVPGQAPEMVVEAEKEAQAVTGEQDEPMNDEQRARLLRMMTVYGLKTPESKLEFFTYALGDQKKTVAFAKSFIASFDAKHKEWVAAVAKKQQLAAS